MFVFSVLVATVAASYPSTNTGGSHYPAPPLFHPYPYLPPYDGDSYDYEDDYDNHHRNPCGNIGFYLPSYPGVLNEAFYTPTIRYIRSREIIQALLACDANGQTVNARTIFSYTGSALVNSAPGYRKNVSVFKVACLRLDKTFLGSETDIAIETLESELAAGYTTTTPAKVLECEAGWTKVERIMGAWCIKVLSLSSPATQTSALQKCTEAGAVISSVENNEELLLIGSPTTFVYIFLGATVKSDCVCADHEYCPETATCSLKTAYTWSDGFTTGTEVFDAAQDGRYGDSLFVVGYGVTYTLLGLHAASTSSYSTAVACGKKPT